MPCLLPLTVICSRLADSLIFAGVSSAWAEAARLLAAYRATDGHDENLAAFTEASIARLNGDYAGALRQYADLLARQPDFARARLDYAKTLFDDKQTREAQAQFARLQQEELPEPVQQNIAAYLNAAKVRGAWHGSLAVGGVRNSNVRETTGETYCFDPTASPARSPPRPKRPKDSPTKPRRKNTVLWPDITACSPAPRFTARVTSISPTAAKTR